MAMAIFCFVTIRGFSWAISRTHPLEIELNVSNHLHTAWSLPGRTTTSGRMSKRIKRSRDPQMFPSTINCFMQSLARTKRLTVAKIAIKMKVLLLLQLAWTKTIFLWSTDKTSCKQSSTPMRSIKPISSASSMFTRLSTPSWLQVWMFVYESSL